MGLQILFNGKRDDSKEMQKGFEAQLGGERLPIMQEPLHFNPEPKRKEEHRKNEGGRGGEELEVQREGGNRQFNLYLESESK